jgi:hypothetical protein
MVLALHFRASVFSLSLHADFVLRGLGEEAVKGVAGQPTEQLVVLSSFLL